jgi:DNA-binding PadR family transcriptional regulator
MSPVFSHGRLRLYLLKLLAEGPKHGYELIRLLENRFLGLYAPSAGTIYPRLQRMQAEGLVTHTAAGGRKTYEITAAGRDELARRAGELAELEGEIHASVADLSVLAGEIEQQVSGSVRDIKKELRDATSQARSSRPPFQRPETWRDRGTGGAGASAGRTPGEGATTDEPARALEEAVSALAAEVTRRARRAGVGETELRAATAVVVSALTELRRLLR